VSHLRRKLQPDPLKPRYIVTEPGVGYRLRIENSGYSGGSIPNK
jgi:two-component system KDP operon response regulator KdpE